MANTRLFLKNYCSPSRPRPIPDISEMYFGARRIGNIGRHVAASVLFTLLLVAFAMELDSDKETYESLGINIQLHLFNGSNFTTDWCTNQSWCALALQAQQEQFQLPVPSFNNSISSDVKMHLDAIKKIQNEPDFDYNLTASSNITDLLNYMQDLVKNHGNDDPNLMPNLNLTMPTYIKNLIDDMQRLLIQNLLLIEKEGNQTQKELELRHLISSSSLKYDLSELQKWFSPTNLKPILRMFKN